MGLSKRTNQRGAEILADAFKVNLCSKVVPAFLHGNANKLVNVGYTCLFVCAAVGSLACNVWPLKKIEVSFCLKSLCHGLKQSVRNNV